MFHNPQYIINNECFKLDPVVGMKKFCILRKVKESRDTKREKAQLVITEECSEDLSCDSVLL